MRNLVVCGRTSAHAKSEVLHRQVVPIAGVPVTFALIHEDDPVFDPDAAENRERVLVRTRAFSLNFRDKAIILGLAQGSSAPTGIGSEFVAEVVACGASIQDLQVGDRVLGDPSYPYSGAPNVPPGVPTDSAAQELQPFHRAKVLKISPGISDDTAAAIAIGAQTSYSMLRRLGLQPGENVLVTAGSSNTSLFALNALKSWPVNTYALTSSSRHRSRLESLGIERVLQVDLQKDELADDPEIVALARRIGGFNAVIDPYSDIYLPRVLSVMALFGRHITCGFYNQYLHLTGEAMPYPSRSASNILFTLLSRNLKTIGNCLGQRTDLTHALADFEEGKLDVILDSVHRGTEIGAFIDRTYNAGDRFGKVVFAYD